MPRFKSIILIKIALILGYFCKKNAKFRVLGTPPAAGGFAPRPPLASGRWGLRLQTPKTALPSRISGYAPGLATSNLDSSVRLMSCMFVHNFKAIGHVTSVLEPENRPASLA